MKSYNICGKSASWRSPARIGAVISLGTGSASPERRSAIRTIPSSSFSWSSGRLSGMPERGFFIKIRMREFVNPVSLFRGKSVSSGHLDSGQVAVDQSLFMLIHLIHAAPGRWRNQGVPTDSDDDDHHRSPDRPKRRPAEGSARSRIRGISGAHAISLLPVSVGVNAKHPTCRVGSV